MSAPPYHIKIIRICHNKKKNKIWLFGKFPAKLINEQINQLNIIYQSDFWRKKNNHLFENYQFYQKLMVMNIWKKTIETVSGVLYSG